MKNSTARIALILLPLALAGCSKSSPGPSPAPKTDSVAAAGTFQDRLTSVISRNTNAAPRQTGDKNVVLPGRRMSERQVIELASSHLPQEAGYRCEFKDGVWEVLEVQKDIWGVSSRTTNAEGKVVVESTNAMRVVLSVRDADGKVELAKTP